LLADNTDKGGANGKVHIDSKEGPTTSVSSSHASTLSPSNKQKKGEKTLQAEGKKGNPLQPDGSPKEGQTSGVSGADQPEAPALTVEEANLLFALGDDSVPHSSAQARAREQLNAIARDIAGDVSRLDTSSSVSTVLRLKREDGSGLTNQPGERATQQVGTGDHPPGLATQGGSPTRAVGGASGGGGLNTTSSAGGQGIHSATRRQLDALTLNGDPGDSVSITCDNRDVRIVQEPPPLPPARYDRISNVINPLADVHCKVDKSGGNYPAFQWPLPQGLGMTPLDRLRMERPVARPNGSGDFGDMSMDSAYSADDDGTPTSKADSTIDHGRGDMGALDASFYSAELCDALKEEPDDSLSPSRGLGTLSPRQLPPIPEGAVPCPVKDDTLYIVESASLPAKVLSAIPLTDRSRDDMDVDADDARPRTGRTPIQSTGTTPNARTVSGSSGNYSADPTLFHPSQYPTPAGSIPSMSSTADTHAAIMYATRNTRFGRPATRSQEEVARMIQERFDAVEQQRVARERRERSESGPPPLETDSSDYDDLRPPTWFSSRPAPKRAAAKTMLMVAARPVDNPICPNREQEETSPTERQAPIPVSNASTRVGLPQYANRREVQYVREVQGTADANGG